MIRAYVICEGQTEQSFVSLGLKSHCADLIQWIPILPGKSFSRPSGGDIRWERIAPDLQRTIKAYPGAIVTTMFDFYALGLDFPNRRHARGRTPGEKATYVQEGMTTALVPDLGSSCLRRFVPYIQMHEFEALMFSDPLLFAETLYQPELAPDFQTILDSAGGNPEAINDGPNTAPSKRIATLFPGYDKILCGSLVADVIGLDKLRTSCSHFDAWLLRIEAVAEQLVRES